MRRRIALKAALTGRLSPCLKLRRWTQVSGQAPGRDPLFGLLLFSGIGAIIGYLGTAALAVALHFVAQARPVTRLVSAVTGTLLAGLGYLPFLWMNWKSSGPDSGPPEETFLGYFLRNWNDPFVIVFLAGGLITALLYDHLARRFNRATAKV